MLLTKLYQKLHYVLIILSLSFISLPAVVLKSDKEAILQIGMEMSQMRNMLEAYILIGVGQKYKDPTLKLSNGITQYETILDSLSHYYIQDEAMQNSIARSQAAWVPVKKAMHLALDKQPVEKMKEGAIFIHGNIRSLIKELAFMKQHLLEQSTIPNKEALNASIEIAASSQRLSTHYMMYLWKLDDPTIEAHWQKGLAIYAESLKVLQHSSYTSNPQFASLLRSCIKYHKYFTKMGKKEKRYAVLIDKKAMIVFNHAKEMTQIILNTH